MVAYYVGPRSGDYEFGYKYPETCPNRSINGRELLQIPYLRTEEGSQDTVEGSYPIKANKSVIEELDRSFITFGGVNREEDIQPFLVLFWNEGVRNLVSLTRKRSEGQLHHLNHLAGKNFGSFLCGEVRTLFSTDDIDVLEMDLTHTDSEGKIQTKEIRQVCYKSWRDHNCIEKTSERAVAKIDMLLDVIHKYEYDSKLPTAINCNGGVSRSGFVCQALVGRVFKEQGKVISLSRVREIFDKQTYFRDSTKGKMTQTKQLEFYYSELFKGIEVVGFNAPSDPETSVGASSPLKRKWTQSFGSDVQRNVCPKKEIDETATTELENEPGNFSNRIKARVSTRRSLFNDFV